MAQQQPPEHGFTFTGQRPATPPDYDRVVRLLTDAELEEEITGKKGEPEYQLALLREADRRAQGGPPR